MARVWGKGWPCWFAVPLYTGSGIKVSAGPLVGMWFRESHVTSPRTQSALLAWRWEHWGHYGAAVKMLRLRLRCTISLLWSSLGFPAGSAVKNPPVMQRHGFPGWGRSTGEGNDNPFQYSCLKNSMDRGAWRAIVHGVAKELDTAEQLNKNNNSYYSW